MAINLKFDDQNKVELEGKKLQNYGVSNVSEAKLDRSLSPASTPSAKIVTNNKEQSQTALGS